VIATLVGARVRELELDDVDGADGIDLDVGMLTSGVYIVRITSEQATATSTITIAR
jgi:hypothetical protein